MVGISKTISAQNWYNLLSGGVLFCTHHSAMKYLLKRVYVIWLAGLWCVCRIDVMNFGTKCCLNSI